MHSFRGKAGSKIANAAQCWGGSGGTLTHHQLHMGVHVSWRDMMPDPENISNIPRRHASISIWRLLLKMMFRCWRWVTYTKVHLLQAILTLRNIFSIKATICKKIATYICSNPLSTVFKGVFQKPFYGIHPFPFTELFLVPKKFTN